MTRAPSDAGMDHIPDGGKMVERDLIREIATELRATKAWPAFFMPGSAEALVRFVLQAAREPTPGMMAAARKEDPMRRKMLGGSPYPEDITGNVDDEFRPLWRAAIDAALRDGEG